MLHFFFFRYFSTHIENCFCLRPLLNNKKVLRPFWKKTWFVLLALILVIVVAAAAVIAISSFQITSPANIGTERHPIRLTSVATTNGDYFKKCAPAVACNANDKYRTYNGSCNNLQNPNWGAALTPFYRLANAEFDDGNILLTKKKKNRLYGHNMYYQLRNSTPEVVALRT